MKRIAANMANALRRKAALELSRDVAATFDFCPRRSMLQQGYLPNARLPFLMRKPEIAEEVV